MTKQKKDLLVFGYGLVIILSFIATRLMMKHGVTQLCYVLYGVAILMLIITVLNLKILKAIYDKWMIGAGFVGHIFSSVILIVLFYCIFAPIGIVLRIMRKDLLDRKIMKDAPTYWQKKINLHKNKSDYLKQF